MVSVSDLRFKYTPKCLRSRNVDAFVCICLQSKLVLMVQTQQNHILLPGSVALNVHLKKSHNSHNKFIIMHIVCSCVYVYEVY